MRRLALAFALLFLITNCKQTPTTNTNLLHLIPQKSAAILRIPDWDTFNETLKINEPSAVLNETGFYNTLLEYADLLKKFAPKDDAYLAFVALGDNDFDLALITKNHPKLLQTDSVFTKNITSYEYEETTVNTITSTKSPVYFLNNEDIFIASTSKLILENTILQNNTGRDPIDLSLEQMIKTSDNGSPNIYVRGSYFKRLFKTIIPDFKFLDSEIPFQWLALDIDLDSKTSLNLSGVLTSEQNGKQTFDLLQDLNPAPSKLILNATAQCRGVISFQYEEWETYKNNLAKKRNASVKDFSVPLEDYFASINELAVVYTNEQNLLLNYSNDITISEKALAPISTKSETFRALDIYKISDSTFIKSTFKELLNPPTVNYYCTLGNLIAFAKSQDLLKDYIANYQNEALLKKTPAYNTLAKKMSDASTLTYYGNTNLLATYLSGKVSKTEAKKLKAIDFEQFPAAMVQLVQADDFTYVNARVDKISAANTAAQVVQTASVQLDQDLLNAPQMLRNYRTKGQNILVQDIGNTLYHIDANGKIEWKKELDGPILGKIQQVDLYKNGRLQYAFTTPSHFYIIASDGTVVKPFDLNYSNITQPLAVFDYSGSRDYRFVITQGNTLTMLDREANKVKGFDYTEAPTTLFKAPQHIRLGSKDYILVQLTSGKLEILNRRGETRIPLKETFDFAESPIFENGSAFLVREKNGSLITISQSGKTSRKALGSGSEIQYDRLNSTEALLLPEQLSINQKAIPIDLGLYTGLKVIKAKNSYYVAMTDLQNNKSFLYTSKGTLLSNFPVYGASELDFGTLHNSKDLGLTLKGESDSVLIYQIN